ncbi:MAG TPA: pyridoxal-phosphate dependent enzyme, partial [Acidobacteriota bacterium]|nr:pyridoxal-phosphate dependent enzyme [Acidobacteriota bacterium]
GMARRLKELNPKLKVVALEPQRSHTQQGLRNMDDSRVPELLDWSAIDEKLVINDQDAFEYTRRLIREEGIFVGISSGTAMAGAIRVAESMQEGNVVTVFPDRGEKYFSTALFD